MRSWYTMTVAIVFGLAPPAGAGSNAKHFAGPVEASVLETLDGDTFLAEARVWPGHTVTIHIRIRGIDAPESKARCPAEREAASRAKAELTRLIGGGPVLLSDIGGAKYYGRVLADVAMPGGEPVADALLRRGLVRPYHGGKRRNWCD
jgi:micrococcal nuclease